jgi:predicted CXXCH cytochrome family protein
MIRKLAKFSRMRLPLAAISLLCLFERSEILLAQEVTGAPSRPPVPQQLAHNQRYTSSHACRECHPDQYQSWHRTFHRTMTQVASPQNFVGRFDGTRIDSHGMSYRVFRRGEQFWAEMPNPDEMIDRQRNYEMAIQRGRPVSSPTWDGIPAVERRVVMSTGSHHYQTYWVESARFPGTLMTLPLVYLIQDERWIPRETAFMVPPGPHRMVTVWNDHCIKCHSTGPLPNPFATVDRAARRVVETGFHTKVGEVGIACEACHGPAQEHIRLRTAAEDGELTESLQQALASDPIIQPESLDNHRLTSYVCGQCHGVYIFTDEQGTRFRDEGIDFVPGDDLLAKRKYLFPPQDAEFYVNEQSRLEALDEFAANRDFFRERYWENGLVLAAGREFSALAVTACYRQGAISCLSCHSMHGSEPNDQLQPGLDGSASCTECHSDPQYTSAVSSHTHHAASSPGSDCRNCHMPHTTYALFNAIRNHQIESPDLAGSVQHGVPNACNLCHLDQTLAWTQDKLADWYGYERQKLSTEQQRLSAALVWMLKGDAAQRVIVAWHVGWKPAQEASGADWLAPFLSRLLADPYGVVRYVAARSLKTLPQFEKFEYDFLAPEDQLARSAAQAAEHWTRQRRGAPSRSGVEVLISREGAVAEQAVRWLEEHRDNRPVTIKE